MAKPDTPKSPATLRAERAAKDKERKADRAKADLLKRRREDEKRERDKLKWGREWKAHDNKMRELDAELRALRKKTYD